MKKQLIHQGRYVGCIDGLIFKIANAPVNVHETGLTLRIWEKDVHEEEIAILVAVDQQNDYVEKGQLGYSCCKSSLWSVMLVSKRSCTNIKKTKKAVVVYSRGLKIRMDIHKSMLIMRQQNGVLNTTHVKMANMKS